MPAALIVHGGGPTQVINATLEGVVEECRRTREISAVHGARFGIEGVLAGDFVDLLRVEPARIAAVARTTGSALGSSRSAVSDYGRIVEILRARDIGYLLVNGGNGSMYMAHGIAQAAGGSLRVIGIPKTIDNDIAGTHHTPGYGSTARFFACAARDIGDDVRSLRGRVTIVEVMGRNTGWLTAATALAREKPGDPPDLIYLPERPLAIDRFFADVEAVFRRVGTVVVAACEGQKDERGQPIGEAGTPDGFERRLSGNMGHTLAQMLIRELGMNARSEKPGLLGRSSMAFVSDADWREAYDCGRRAVQAATAGETDCMVALPAGLVELGGIAGVERVFPAEWIARGGHDVTREFLDYARPLTGKIDGRPRLV